jgi:Phage-related lysozyme (muraminidase)
MALNLIPASTGGGWLSDGGESDMRKKIAMAMAMQSMTADPVGTKAGIASKVLQGAYAGYQANQMGQEERAATQTLMNNMPGLSGAAPGPQAEAPSSNPFAGIAKILAGPAPADAAAPTATPVAAPSGDILDKIKDFEGFAPKAAWDYKQNTNGYGTRATSPGEIIDPATAETRLRDEVGKASGIVDKFKPDLPPGVRDALTSLTYNAGDKWTRSGLGQAIQSGDMTGAKDRFLQYNKAGGQTLPGLVNRRQQEAAWFDQPQAPNAPVRVASLGSAPQNDSPAPAAQPPMGQPVQLAQAGGQPQIPQGGQPVAAPPPGSRQGPQIPPEVAAQIRGLLANPRTRAYGMQIYQQYAAPPSYGFQMTPDGTILRQDPRSGTVAPVYQAPTKPTFGDIGVDPNSGEALKGFIDPSKRQIDPYRPPGAQNAQPSTIPPVPPGVDPKVWRETHSKGAAANAAPGTPDDAYKVRNEIQGLPSYKNIAQAAPVYKSMLGAAARDTRAADVNLIYGMAKLMDPGSVVRESEMTIAQAIATLPQYLQAQVTSQMNATGRLDPAVRAGIMEEAHSRVQSYSDMYGQDAGMYRGIVGRRNMKEEDVIPNFGAFDPYKPPAPAGATPAPASGLSRDELEAEMRRRNLLK